MEALLQYKVHLQQSSVLDALINAKSGSLSDDINEPPSAKDVVTLRCCQVVQALHLTCVFL